MPRCSDCKNYVLENEHAGCIQGQTQQDPEVCDSFSEVLSFLDLYLMLHKARTNSPPIYGNHLCFQLLGHALGRESYNALQPNAVRHNTYLALLGSSGTAMKTTAIDDVIKPLVPLSKLGTASFSPEGLLKWMEEKPWVWCPMGEMSTLLRSICHGGNMANFKEISNDLWKCPPWYEKPLVSKQYYVKSPYLSINTTCTEEEFFENINHTMVHGGFLPRWLLVYSESPEWRPRTKLPPYVAMLEKILGATVNNCYEVFGRQPLKFELSEKAEKRLDELSRKYTTDPRYESVQPFLKRYVEYSVAYADIWVLSDALGRVLRDMIDLTDPTDPTYNIERVNTLIHISVGDFLNALRGYIEVPVVPVEAKDIDRGWRLTQPCLDYALGIAQYVDEEQIIRKLLIQLNKLPPNGEIMWSVLSTKTKLLLPHFINGINTLVEREVIRIETREVGEGQAKKHPKYIIKTDKYQGEENEM